MKMKRAMALALAAAMSLSLAACGGSDSGNQPAAGGNEAGANTSGGSAGGENQAAPAEGDKVVINFFHRWPNDPKNSMFNELIQQYKIGRAHV